MDSPGFEPEEDGHLAALGAATSRGSNPGVDDDSRRSRILLAMQNSGLAGRTDLKVFRTVLSGWLFSVPLPRASWLLMDWRVSNSIG